MSGAEARAIAVVNACLESGDERAWREFVQLFQPLIASVILRVMRRFGKSDWALADDLIQEAYVRLCKENCKALRTFEHRREDSIFAFVKVVAASVAMDHFRARNAEKRAAEIEAQTEESLGFVVAADPNVQGKLLLGEVDSQLERVAHNDRDKTIFWLYYQQGYTARDISRIPGIQLSPKGVESSLLRLTQAIRQHLNPAEMRARGKDGGEGVSPSSPVGEVR